MDLQHMERLAMSLEYLREATGFDAKYENIKRYCLDHPVTSLFVMVMLCMCSVPIGCFATFIVGSLIFCFTGFLIIEGTILTVASLLLGGTLVMVIFVSIFVSSALISIFYVTQVLQRSVEALFSSYQVPYKRVPDESDTLNSTSDAR